MRSGEFPFRIVVLADLSGTPAVQPRHLRGWNLVAALADAGDQEIMRSTAASFLRGLRAYGRTYRASGARLRMLACLTYRPFKRID